MTYRFLVFLFLFIYSYQISAGELNSDKSPNEKKIDITLRTGQGGFTDSRSPIGKLGGGQMTLDMKFRKYPLALSITGEYYTNSPDPEDPFEISDLVGFNLLYMKSFLPSRRLTLFTGGGTGWLEVPKGEAYPGEVTKDIFYDIECGIRYRVFWKIGVYGIYKYLYAQKDPFIDFSEHIILLGLSFSFSL